MGLGCMHVVNQDNGVTPDQVETRGRTAITPALFISTSMVGSPPSAASRRAGSDLTERRSARSSSIPMVLPPTSFAACSALACVRADTTTLPPAAARRLALSRPSPVFAPVMKIVVPSSEPAAGL